MIAFKTEALIYDWPRLVPKLREVLLEAHGLMPSSESLIITSGIRDGKDDNPLSVHYHGRGADARSWSVTKNEAEKVRDAINDRWVYDPDRPDMVVCMIHDAGSGEHFHFQVHPNTVRA